MWLSKMSDMQCEQTKLGLNYFHDNYVKCELT